MNDEHQFRCPCCHKRLAFDAETGKAREVQIAKKEAPKIDKLLEAQTKDRERLADTFAKATEDQSSQADRFDAPTYVYMITLLEELRRNVKYSGAARALADAAIVRLSMSHQFSEIGSLIAHLEGRGDAPSPPPQVTDLKKNDVAKPSGLHGPRRRPAYAEASRDLAP